MGTYAHTSRDQLTNQNAADITSCYYHYGNGTHRHPSRAPCLFYTHTHTHDLLDLQFSILTSFTWKNRRYAHAQIGRGGAGL